MLLVETERRLDLHRDDVDILVRVGAISDDRLVARRLGGYPHVLMASKEYVARAGAPAAPEDLESHSIVAFGGRSRISRWELVPVRGGETVRVPLGEVSLHVLFPADRLLSRAVRAAIEAIVARVPADMERSA